jgi:hypothetical protein
MKKYHFSAPYNHLYVIYDKDRAEYQLHNRARVGTLTTIIDFYTEDNMKQAIKDPPPYREFMQNQWGILNLKADCHKQIMELCFDG